MLRKLKELDFNGVLDDFVLGPMAMSWWFFPKPSEKICAVVKLDLMQPQGSG